MAMKKNAVVATRQRNKAASVRGAGPAATKPARTGAAGTEVTRKVARSAETGRMVTKAQAKADPTHTVTETVKVRKAKGQDQEQRFVLMPVDKYGQAEAHQVTDDPMTKGELLSMLAEEVLAEPVGKVKVHAGKIPKSLASAADLLYTTRQDRLALNRHVEAMKVQERALREHLIDNLPKSDASGVAGKVARAQVKTEDEPVVQDWDAFYKSIKKTGAFELLNKAPNRKAIKERWNNKKEVPGVGHFESVKISLTKVGG